jgi:Holliday junction resolvase
MVDVRAKGAKAETDIKNILKKYTGLGWERTPGSGALDEKHMLKGDLYIPGKENLYCVECKHYQDDHINSGILTNKTPQIIEWWMQAVRQGSQVGRKPLLIFKHNRSKMFVAYEDMPSTTDYRMILIGSHGYEFYISLLEDWLTYEKPKFIK